MRIFIIYAATGIIVGSLFGWQGIVSVVLFMAATVIDKTTENIQ